MMLDILPEPYRLLISDVRQNGAGPQGLTCTPRYSSSVPAAAATTYRSSKSAGPTSDWLKLLYRTRNGPAPVDRAARAAYGPPRTPTNTEAATRAETNPPGGSRDNRRTRQPTRHLRRSTPLRYAARHRKSCPAALQSCAIVIDRHVCYELVTATRAHGGIPGQPLATIRNRPDLRLMSPKRRLTINILHVRWVYSARHEYSPPHCALLSIQQRLCGDLHHTTEQRTAIPGHLRCCLARRHRILACNRQPAFRTGSGASSVALPAALAEETSPTPSTYEGQESLQAGHGPTRLPSSSSG